MIDENGQSLVLYSLDDPLDVRNSRRALDAQVRLHVAAGAHEISALAAGSPTWRVGDDVDAYVARLQRIPLRAGGFRLFCAHQMGHLPHGARTQGAAWPTRTASCTTRRGCGSATAAPSRPLRAPTR